MSYIVTVLSSVSRVGLVWGGSVGTKNSGKLIGLLGFAPGVIVISSSPLLPTLELFLDSLGGIV